MIVTLLEYNDIQIRITFILQNIETTFYQSFKDMKKVPSKQYFIKTYFVLKQDNFSRVLTPIS